MNKKKYGDGGGRELACPICKHPVGVTVQRRRKSFGVFVPVWGPGSCHNPDCPEYLVKPERSFHRR
ncbi:hypothetical protein QQY24_30385 [Streptomyces sp. TG1A-8]|nr:hypothetical protein [Streptomyces sp. TG1A-8]MDO0929501.1 hypothetical protein [Streptomyces sp. TG1A-8]